MPIPTGDVLSDYAVPKPAEARFADASVLFFLRISIHCARNPR